MATAIIVVKIPSRAEALLGWIGFWASEDFGSRIKEVYEKRSAFVHSGDRHRIKATDVEFTDHLLLNLFSNIVGHHALFKSKQDVINFSKRVEAEKLLGVNAKVRPKTLRFLHSRNRDGDSFYRT